MKRTFFLPLLFLAASVFGQAYPQTVNNSLLTGTTKVDTITPSIVSHGNLGSDEAFDATYAFHTGTLNSATCDATLQSWTTPGVVQTITIRVTQDATGGRLMTFTSTGYDASSNAVTAPLIDPVASHVTFLTFQSIDGGITVDVASSYGPVFMPTFDHSAAYTTLISDANSVLRHPSTDNSARVFTIDSNANVAYAIGTTITFVNEINTLTIAVTSDTITLQGSNQTGSVDLAAGNTCTALKVAATKWIVNGSAGLTHH